MMTLSAPRFYPIVDQLSHLETFVDLGFTWIQWRQKSNNQTAPTAAVQLFKRQRRHYWQKLILNDDVALAASADFDGVHVGQEDLSQQIGELQAFQKLGKIVGISTHNPHEINRALQYQPNYLAFGPLFPSPTKTALQPLPPEVQQTCLQQISACQLPTIAIGGIDSSNCAGLFRRGFAGVAFIQWQEAVIAKRLTPQQLWREIHLNY